MSANLADLSLDGLVRGMRRVTLWLIALLAIAGVSALDVASAPLVSRAAAAAPAGQYVPLKETRIVDSRINKVIYGRMSDGAYYQPTLGGQGGIPTSGVSGVVLVITTINGPLGGYLTAWTAGQPQPAIATINYNASTPTIDNTVVLPLDGAGNVGLKSSGGSTDITIDVQGYYTSGTSTTTSWTPETTPCRVLNQSVSSEMPVSLAGKCGLPSSGVTAVDVNITLLNPSVPTYLEVWPTGQSQPTDTAALLGGPGQNTEGFSTIALNAGESFEFLMSANASAIVYIDIEGYHSQNSGGHAFTAMSTARLLDTRNGQGTSSGQAQKVSSGQNPPLQFQVTGKLGLPASVTAVVVDVTLFLPSAGTTMTVWPGGTASPTTATVSAPANITVQNSLVVPVGNGGTLDIGIGGSTSATADAVVDLEGYYSDIPGAPPTVSPPAAPTAVSATPGDSTAHVTWTPPANPGSSAIMSYTATSSPGGFSHVVSGASTSAEVNGLSNGTSYTFTVAATNNAGTGPASSPSNSVTPNGSGPPGSVGSIDVSVDDGSAALTWSGAAAIPAVTGYSVVIYNDDGSVTPSPTVSVTGTTAAISGLTNGNTYYATVSAQNGFTPSPVAVSPRFYPAQDMSQHPAANPQGIPESGQTGQNTYPPVSHSFYVESNSPSSYGQYGVNVGKYDVAHCSAGNGPNRGAAKMTILAFNQPRRLFPINSYNGYGVNTNSNNKVAGADVVRIAEAYAEGYMRGLNGSTCPALRLLMGVNNSQICGTSPEASGGADAGCTRSAAGSAWYQITDTVAHYVRGRNWQATIAVGMADDIETSADTYKSGNSVWDNAGATFQFLDAFHAANANSSSASYNMFDFGEAVTSPGRWSIADVYSAASERYMELFAIPQIYTPSQTCDWTGFTPFRGQTCNPNRPYSVEGYAKNKNGGDFFLPGVITQCRPTNGAATGDVPPGNYPGDMCRSQGFNQFGPKQAWNDLFGAISKNYGAKTLDYATNI